MLISDSAACSKRYGQQYIGIMYCSSPIICLPAVLSMSLTHERKAIGQAELTLVSLWRLSTIWFTLSANRPQSRSALLIDANELPLSHVVISFYRIKT